jgi:hypothetical protein
MTLLLKDPEASLDYAVDWGAEYLNGDAISQSEWQVVPVEAGGLVIAGGRFDSTVATVTASGGVPGRLYQLTNTVVLESGLSDSRSIVLRVEQR